jgi:hypothetical protein
MVDIFTVPPHPYTERELSVVKILENNKDLNIESLLNVGFHGWDDFRTHWWIRICEENNINWKILEIYKPNVFDAIAKGCPTDKIILGDILNTDTYDNADCILFWHGPEHIDKKTFLNALPKIESKANKLIIFGMPLGYEPQDAAYGNIHEVHLSEWQPDDWNLLKYNTIIIKDRIDYNHITSYKNLNTK